MNPTLIKWALTAVGLLMMLKRDGLTEQLKNDFDNLKKELVPLLPVKEDGTAWTEEDLDALRAEHFAFTSELRERHKQ
jgi:hypothetical protein